jgi:hypothetical protein
MNENNEQPGMASAARHGGDTSAITRFDYDYAAGLFVNSGGEFVKFADVEPFLRATKTESGEAVWQEMGSAPQDGSEILIRFPMQGNVKSLASFNTVYKYWSSKGGAIFPVEQKCEWTHLPSDEAAAPVPPLPAPAAPKVAPDFVPDTSQEWGKLDGAVAWHLIERHADSWNEVGNMMDSWLAARAAAQAAPATPTGIPAILFDGHAVYKEVMANDPNTPRPTADNVANVLDAVVRLLRREAPATPAPAAPQAVQAQPEQTQQSHVMPPFAAPAGQHEWHRVSEIKPPEGVSVLVYYPADKDEPYRIDEWDTQDNPESFAAANMEGWLSFPNEGITHWAHLSPPNEVSGTPVPRVGGNTNDSRADLTAPSSTEARATADEDARDAERFRKVVRLIGYAETGTAEGPVWTLDLPRPSRWGNTDENFVAAIDALRTTSTSQAPASGTEGAMVCATCGADRSKEKCKAEHWQKCPMVGVAGGTAGTPDAEGAQQHG